MSLDSPAFLKMVRMILSGVTRCQRELRIDAGKALVTQMLCGSESAKMESLGMKRLSTYGLLSDFVQKDVTAVIQGLIDAGYLKQVEPEPKRPVIHMTDLGFELMHGRPNGTMEIGLPVTTARRLKAKLGEGDAPCLFPRKKRTRRKRPKPVPNSTVLSSTRSVAGEPNGPR